MVCPTGGKVIAPHMVLPKRGCHRRAPAGPLAVHIGKRPLRERLRHWRASRWISARLISDVANAWGHRWLAVQLVYGSLVLVPGFVMFSNKRADKDFAGRGLGRVRVPDVTPTVVKPDTLSKNVIPHSRYTRCIPRP